MSLFQVESQDDGVYVIKTSQDDEAICSVVFEDTMSGVLEYKAQRVLMQKLSEAMQKVCYAHWIKEE